MRAWYWCVILLVFVGGPGSAAAAIAAEPIPTRCPGVPRIVAIGDLHGDLDACRRALRLGGAIDDADRWIGGDLVVVQTGDQLDRGDDEQAIIDLFTPPLTTTLRARQTRRGAPGPRERVSTS